MIAGPAGLPTALEGMNRTLVMGVLNVTPDSFSDGGMHADLDSAVRAGLRMHAEGADLVDVGGESTRPGASRVAPEEERRRVLPVVEQLSAASVPVSVDTMRAGLAAECVEAGAVLVNDVSGGLADAGMLPTVAELQVPYVVMHWRGHGWDMDSRATYDDVVDEVRGELASRLAACEEAGIDPSRVVLDPGIGFAKLPHHNWELLRALDRFAELGCPLLVGASRKRFLGALLAEGGEPRSIEGRAAATVALTALVASAGVWGVRVHDVRDNADAISVVGMMIE